MILWGAAALGAIASPVLVELLGIRGTLVAAGAPVALLALAVWGSLRRIDAATAPSPVVDLLRGVPLFAPLPLPALERLAEAATPLAVAAGTDVVREGQAGDRFYVVESGSDFEVTANGQSVATLGRGTTSAKSRSCAMFRGLRQSLRSATPSCTPSIARNSSGS